MTAQFPEFYLRQSSLPKMGPAGVARLRSATVGIAGVGGLGSSAAYHLVRSGIGGVRLIDQDIVEPSNLQRIVSSQRPDLFHPKAEVISQRLSSFDPSTRIEPYVETITNRNVEELFGRVDLILDGLDNFRTRYILNRFSFDHNIPYLFTSAVAQQFHQVLLSPPRTPCLECIMPRVNDRIEDSCENLGISPIVTGIAGAMGADKAIRFLLDPDSAIEDRMLTFDIDGPELLFTRVSKRQGCPACTQHGGIEAQGLHPVTWLCGEHTANILPPEKMELKLSQVSQKIPTHSLLVSSASVLVYRHGPYTISLFRNGRVLIGGIAEEEAALQVARDIWQRIK